MDRKLIFEKSGEDVSWNITPSSSLGLGAIEDIIPSSFLRDSLPLPSVGELEVVRHYTGLSRRNFSIDSHFYPLGSCTMKYNPKVNEDMASLAGFRAIHPYQDPSTIQGALELIWRLEMLLCELTGMARFSFQPCAGAHGEFAGLRIIRDYHTLHNTGRTKILVPDSAHGTNPASACMCGFNVVEVKSTPGGLIDMKALKRLIDSDTAGMMLTNPNTLGLFEENILDISRLLHKEGALLYYDGANFNPLMTIAKPSAMGFDVIHLNLHKTFSTPHGTGGPGAGALGVRRDLIDFLPVPLINQEGGVYSFYYDIPYSIGRVRSFYGNFPVLVRAYTYLIRLGTEGLRRAAQNAVLNANYVSKKLKDHYTVASPKQCMHEVVFSCMKQKAMGILALDVAKRLIDYGIHPPTMYFPLIVKEALMVEPTETENKDTLDFFIETMKEIDRDSRRDPGILKSAPKRTPVTRVDEVKAARSPDFRWKLPGE